MYRSAHRRKGFDKTHERRKGIENADLNVRTPLCREKSYEVVIGASVLDGTICSTQRRPLRASYQMCRCSFNAPPASGDSPVPVVLLCPAMNSGEDSPTRKTARGSMRRPIRSGRADRPPYIYECLGQQWGQSRLTATAGCAQYFIHSGWRHRRQTTRMHTTRRRPCRPDGSDRPSCQMRVRRSRTTHLHSSQDLLVETVRELEVACNASKAGAGSGYASGVGVSDCDT